MPATVELFSVSGGVQLDFLTHMVLVLAWLRSAVHIHQVAMLPMSPTQHASVAGQAP